LSSFSLSPSVCFCAISSLFLCNANAQRDGTRAAHPHEATKDAAKSPALAESRLGIGVQPSSPPLEPIASVGSSFPSLLPFSSSLTLSFFFSSLLAAELALFFLALASSALAFSRLSILGSLKFFVSARVFFSFSLLALASSFCVLPSKSRAREGERERESDQHFSRPALPSCFTFTKKKNTRSNREAHKSERGERKSERARERGAFSGSFPCCRASHAAATAAAAPERLLPGPPLVDLAHRVPR